MFFLFYVFTKFLFLKFIFTKKYIYYTTVNYSLYYAIFGRMLLFLEFHLINFKLTEFEKHNLG